MRRRLRKSIRWQRSHAGWRRSHRRIRLRDMSRRAKYRSYAAMAGIRRSKGTAPAAKTPTLTDDIRMMIAATPESLLGIRDRALLLVGFAGAFRRSELVGI